MVKSTTPTSTEKEILRLINEEFYTIEQIANRRKTSIHAVYKHIRNLKKKGLLKKVKNFQPTPNQRDIRLHGQELNIKIILQEPHYQKYLDKSNILFLDGNTVRLYKNSLEIYSGQSFYGKTTNEAELKSLEYFERFIRRLENDLKVILLKNRSRNIRIVNQHYARGDSELSERAHEEKKRIWIYADDGKLFYITDDSFGFKEDECVHPTTAKKDREAVDKQINDWRNHNPPTNSELAEHIAAVTSNQLMFAQNMASHIKAIQRLGNEVKGLSRTIKGLRKENTNLKLELNKQKRLDNWL